MRDEGVLSGDQGLAALRRRPAAGDSLRRLGARRQRLRRGVTKVGQSQVGSFATTQYHATISLDRFPDTLPPARRPSARQTVAALEKLAQVHDLPVDVWVDGRHFVRRIRLSFTEKLPTGQQLTALYTIQVPEYGPQTPPVFPPASQVSDLSSLMHAGG